MLSITLDFGASFLKGACFRNGKLEKVISKVSPAVSKEDWWISHRIKILIRIIREMIAELSGGAAVFELALSNEMHGFLLTDEKGNLVTDYISWQKSLGEKKLDSLGKTAIDVLSQSDFLEAVQKTGMSLYAGLPSTNLLALLQSGKIDETCTYRFYTLGDYILYNLSGQEPFCHPTNAASTGLYDLSTGEWNKILIKAIGAEHIIFPHVGNARLQFLLQGATVMAYSAIGDQQAALLGAGITKQGQLSFNLGTGAQVSTLSKELVFSSDWQTRPYFQGCWLRSIPHLPSGRAMNVYFRFVKEVISTLQPDITDEVVWQIILQKVEVTKTSAMCCDLSFFSNPLTSEKHGSIVQIGEYDFTIGKLFFAIFEQMASGFIQASEILMKKEDVQKIVFSGGIARRLKKIRERILSEYRGIPYIVAHDETLYGLMKFIRESRM